MSAKLETTHIVTENELVVYRRERSSIWQCRYKVEGQWQLLFIAIVMNEKFL